MIEPAVILLRLVQYAGAAILFGSSLFLLYAFRARDEAFARAQAWPRRLLLAGAFATLVGSLAGLVAQTALMAGSWSEGIKPASLEFVVTGMGLGRAAVVRTVAAASALAVLALARPGRRTWIACALFGTIVCVSLAWMGHAAATEGTGAAIHLASDALHLLAAAAWIGALAAFLILVATSARATGPAQQAVYAALHGFSGIGSVLVATLLATGLVNSWFLVGPDGLQGLWTTPYGRLLLTKLGLFGLMLALAAGNRFALTPRLGRSLAREAAPGAAFAALRASLVLEAIAGVLVLALVAWLGTLPPISAQ